MQISTRCSPTKDRRPAANGMMLPHAASNHRRHACSGDRAGLSRARRSPRRSPTSSAPRPRYRYTSADILSFAAKFRDLEGVIPDCRRKIFRASGRQGRKRPSGTGCRSRLASTRARKRAVRSTTLPSETHAPGADRSGRRAAPVDGDSHGRVKSRAGQESTAAAICSAPSPAARQYRRSSRSKSDQNSPVGVGVGVSAGGFLRRRDM